MGGVIRTIFGGSKSTQKNKAYPLLSEQLGGNLSKGNTAMDTLGGLLGLGGSEQADAALKGYLDSTFYDKVLESGGKAIASNAAVRGLLKSGATLKAATEYGQFKARDSLKDYITALASIGQYGLNSANAISGAGVNNKMVENQSIFKQLFPGGVGGSSS